MTKPNPKSRTQQAIRLVDRGLTPYAAAKRVKLDPSALYRALAARKKKLDSDLM